VLKSFHPVLIHFNELPSCSNPEMHLLELNYRLSELTLEEAVRQGSPRLPRNRSIAFCSRLLTKKLPFKTIKCRPAGIQLLKPFLAMGAESAPRIQVTGCANDKGNFLQKLSIISNSNCPICRPQRMFVRLDQTAKVALPPKTFSSKTSLTR